LQALHFQFEKDFLEAASARLAKKFATLYRVLFYNLHISAGTPIRPSNKHRTERSIITDYCYGLSLHFAETNTISSYDISKLLLGYQVLYLGII